jgi:hypothetical protein
MSGTTQPRGACPSDALRSGVVDSRARRTTLESLLFALLLALLSQLAPGRRSTPSHPATTIVPGQRHAPGRAPHALAFALRLVPDWIFSTRNRGMRPRARTASRAQIPSARDPPA